MKDGSAMRRRRIKSMETSYSFRRGWVDGYFGHEPQAEKYCFGVLFDIRSKPPVICTEEKILYEKGYRQGREEGEKDRR